MVFTLAHGNYIWHFQHSEDVNGDGFIDITQNQKWNQEVYLFNPKNQRFAIDQIQYRDYINAEWDIIDTSRKIFCDFQGLSEKCVMKFIQLFTLIRI